MNKDDIDPNGWTVAKATATRIGLFNDQDTLIIAHIDTPLKNFIPLITSNKRPWAIEFKKQSKLELKEKREYESKEEALQDLQTYLEENPVK